MSESQAPGSPRSIHEGLPDRNGKSTSPWWWIPTANFASGLPYVIVATLSTIVFKNMGVSNEANAFWSSLLLTPWTFKPLWSPLIDKYWTKRNWIVLTQFLVGCAMFLVAAAMQFPTSPAGALFGGFAKLIGAEDLPQFFLIALIFLALAGLLSATYDIACDGFYMLALKDDQQAFFVGIRSTFYRLAMIGAGGLLPIVAGLVQMNTGPEPVSVRVSSSPTAETTIAAESPAVVGSAAEQRLLVWPEEVTVAPGASSEFTIRLAQQPEPNRQVVVLTRVEDGPAGLAFKRGDRVVFDSANWDQPTTVTIEVAKNAVKSESEWELRSTAGRIALSWTVVFVGVGFLLIGASGYHAIRLPAPHSDAPQTENRPPLGKAIFWLGLVVVTPGLLWWISSTVLINRLDATKTEIIKGFVDNGQVMMSKLTPVVFQLGSNSAVLVVIALLMLIGPLRRTVGSAYKAASDASGIGFYEVFGTFFAKHKIGVILGFILLFRLGESQIVKMGPVFLLDEGSKGGLALTPSEVGWIYQTIGVICLLLGGLIGGWLISTFGLRKVIWPLVAAIHVPNFFYVYMAYAQPQSLWIIGGCVGIEQLGYGIGFAAFMMYLIFAADGAFKTSHYALCTGFMSLGMQVPMMFSGFLQGALGYPIFFLMACLMVIPGVLVIPFLPMSNEFGKRK